MSVKARSVHYDIEFPLGEKNHKYKSLKSKRIKTTPNTESINNKISAWATTEHHKKRICIYSYKKLGGSGHEKLKTNAIIAFFRKKQNQTNNT